MQVQAITKNVRMSAQKMREVVRQIQGLPAAHAQAALAVTPRKGARFVAKTLKSAIANAEDLKTGGEGSIGADRQHPAALYAQGPRVRRPHPEAQLPHQNCFIGRVITHASRIN
jgi:hypothetical protein